MRVCGRLLARLRVVGGIWWGDALAGDTAGIYFCAAAGLDLRYHGHRGAGHDGHQRGDARKFGHRYLRLGLGLGLFFSAHFLQQGPLCFLVAWVGQAAGRAARW
jgi:hypothetical protein